MWLKRFAFNSGFHPKVANLCVGKHAIHIGSTPFLARHPLLWIRDSATLGEPAYEELESYDSTMIAAAKRWHRDPRFVEVVRRQACRGQELLVAVHAQPEVKLATHALTFGPQKLLSAKASRSSRRAGTPPANGSFDFEGTPPSRVGAEHYWRGSRSNSRMILLRTNAHSGRV